jgi:hypothetical protein
MCNLDWQSSACPCGVYGLLGGDRKVAHESCQVPGCGSSGDYEQMEAQRRVPGLMSGCWGELPGGSDH